MGGMIGMGQTERKRKRKGAMGSIEFTVSWAVGRGVSSALGEGLLHRLLDMPEDSHGIPELETVYRGQMTFRVQTKLGLRKNGTLEGQCGHHTRIVSKLHLVHVVLVLEEQLIAKTILARSITRWIITYLMSHSFSVSAIGGWLGTSNNGRGWGFDDDPWPIFLLTYKSFQSLTALKYCSKPVSWEYH